MSKIIPRPGSSVPEEITDYRVCYFLDSQFRGYFEMHQHSYYEILLHCGGGIQFSADRQIYDMRPGDVYIIPPFLVHGLIGQEKLNDYERLFVHITPPALRSLGFGIVSFQNILDSHIQKVHYRLSLSPDRFAILKELLSALHSADDELTPYEELENRMALSAFLLELCRNLDRAEESGAAPQHNSLAYRVLDYINLHFTEDCSLDLLAKYFSTSKYNLAHRFSGEFHMSPYQYVLFRRISFARELINKNESLLSVAYQSGFNDYSNFLRAFVRITGMNPSDYRRIRT